MTEQDLKYLDIPHAGSGPVRIAMRQSSHQPDARSPGLFWLSGFNSSMDGSKATAIATYAEGAGRGFTRFDYSGHGLSEGNLEDGTITHWLNEAKAVFSCTSGPQIVVGSSMGGWIALLLAQHLQPTQRIAGIVLIAPATDMTEQLMWRSFSDEIRRQIASAGVYLRPSAYGDGPYPITRSLIDDGRTHLFGDNLINPGAPLRILHGMEDPDVPWQHSLQLIQQVTSGDVRLTLIKDGDHRLSRQADLRLLIQIIAGLTPADQSVSNNAASPSR